MLFFCTFMGCHLDVHYFPVHASDSAEMFNFKKI